MKPTKASLLASLLSLLLCVSMLVGTTMAWFTDTTSTNVVKIVAGNFDVPILELAAGGNTSKDLQAKDGSSTLLWTSGATHELKPFRIKNTGTVAMTYKIRIAGVTGGNAALLDVIDFSVAVGGGALQPLGEAVAELEAGAVTPSITLTGTMQATAGEEYQNQTFDGIKIILSAEEKGAEQNTTSVMENGREFTSGTHVLTTGVTATAAGADALRVFGSETQVIIQSGAFDGGSGGPNTCIWAKDGATVRIEGGTFTVGDDANSEGNSVIYATTGAKVIISGGFFYTNTPYNGFYYVLNQKNDAPGTFEVTGGTFVNFDPSKGDDNLGGNFVKDGYKVVSETKENGEVWYTVEESSTPSLPTVATLSDEDFSYSDEDGQYARKRFAVDGASGLACVVQVHRKNVSEASAFRLKLTEVDNKVLSDFMVLISAGNTIYLKVELEGFKREMQDPHLYVEFIGAVWANNLPYGPYKFDRSDRKTNVDGEPCYWISDLEK